MSRESYDAVPYTDRTFPLTHPSHLGAIGRFLGVPAADLERCRVLSIGCASGWNITAMAARLPEAVFVGIDYSSVQINAGLKRLTDLREAGFPVDNVSLVCGDIGDGLQSSGPFDYVIAHGMYSWLDAETRHSMMTLIRDSLAPNGLAFVSFNTMPGWGVYGTLRRTLSDMLGTVTDKASLKIQQANALKLLHFLATTEGTNAKDVPLRNALRYVAHVVHGQVGASPEFLAHEYLETHASASWFDDFAADADTHDLAHLIDAHTGSWMLGDFTAGVETAVHNLTGLGAASYEQLTDTLRMAVFRRAILIKAGTTWTNPPKWRGLETLWISHDYERLDAGSYRARGDASRTLTLKADSALDRALAALVAVPQGLPFRALAKAAKSNREELGPQLLGAVVRGAVTIRLCPAPFTYPPTETPTAHPFVLACQKIGLTPASARHEDTPLHDFVGTLLQLCDGTRDVDALVSSLNEIGESPADFDVAKETASKLEALARNGYF